MEALVFDGTKKLLKYETKYSKPCIKSGDEVMVKVAYSGVCGTDLHIMLGEYPSQKDKPLIMGHEFSGVIAEVGDRSKFRKGQRVVVDPNRSCNLCKPCQTGRYQFCKTEEKCNVGVFRDGGWAQYVVVPQDQVFLLPDSVTLEQGALCEPYSCVTHGFRKASPITIGDKILVVGAGIIGNLWLTTLHVNGHLDVTVCELNKSRLEIVKNLGTNYRLITPDVLEKEDLYYDLIIDCTGVGKSMECNFKYLEDGGKFVVFGCCPMTHTATINPFNIFNKELTIIGVKVNPFSFPSAIGLLASMGDRYVNYECLGIKVYKLKDYSLALQDLKNGSISKAVFKID